MCTGAARGANAGRTRGPTSHSGPWGCSWLVSDNGRGMETLTPMRSVLYTGIQYTHTHKLCICNSLCMCVLGCFSCVQLFANLCATAHQAPLSMGFPREEYWSGLPFPSPGDLSRPRGCNVGVPCCRQILYHLSHQRSPPRKWEVSQSTLPAPTPAWKGFWNENSGMPTDCLEQG